MAVDAPLNTGDRRKLLSGLLAGEAISGAAVRRADWPGLGSTDERQKQSSSPGIAPDFCFSSEGEDIAVCSAVVSLVL